jgi:hypothetical protein
MLREPDRQGFRAWVSHCAAYVLILTLCLPSGAAFAPARADAADRGDGAFVRKRLNSPERKAAVEEAVLKKTKDIKIDSSSAANDKGRKKEMSGPALLPAEDTASRTAGDTRDNTPRPLSYILMEQGASFLGVPAPMLPGADEGLGFHQDGTVRKAGGSGNAGPSDGGRRAAAYAGSGLGYGGGGAGGSYLDGYVPLSGIGYDHLTGRYDASRDGRRSNERRFDGFDPVRTAQDRVLSWGIGALNSAGEAAVSSIVDKGRARLNFTVDWDGNFRGEGDVLLPFYDGQYTTVFTQIGTRSMAVSGGEADGQDRWIGNFGLGQRWFPAAKDEEDAGDWMVGYNAFFDNDFTRSHQRGGVGVELQYDWLHLASNYYLPLSDWKGSYDFDSRFIEERPAEGWDARVKAYLPFYRNVALTGAYTQWHGDHVGMFGHGKLEKDPRVWSYGAEYTPVPLVSGFLTQRSTERGRTETEYGLNFTYHFGMPWDEQVKHAKVAELRTVSGSRHEFVDRENRIILEYRAKKDAYRIEYLRKEGDNSFYFRVVNGFGEIQAGMTVDVWTIAPIPGGKYLVAEGGSDVARRNYVTDDRGEFFINLSAANLPTDGKVTVDIQAGDTIQTFTLNGPPLNGLVVEFSGGGDFVTGGPQGYQTIVTMTVKKYVNGVVDTSWTPNGNVLWTVTSAAPALSGNVWKRSGFNLYGLAWTDQTGLPNNYTGSWAGDVIVQQVTAPTGVTAYLADVVGSRTITVTVADSSESSVAKTFTFGAGPLSVFSKTGTGATRWATKDGNGGFQSLDGTSDTDFRSAVGVCGGEVKNKVTTNSSADDANFTPDEGGWDEAVTVPGVSGKHRYAHTSKLAKAEQLLAVAAFHNYYNTSVQRKGAAMAAGWSLGGVTYAWTGEVAYSSTGYFVAVRVRHSSGSVGRNPVTDTVTLAVCLQ